MKTCNVPESAETGDIGDVVDIDNQSVVVDKTVCFFKSFQTRICLPACAFKVAEYKRSCHLPTSQTVVA